MNERIKLLATQAGGEFFEGFAGSPDSIKFKEDEFQKFAELIVRECAKVCDELQKWPSTEPRHCASDIRIHFGVE